MEGGRGPRLILYFDARNARERPLADHYVSCSCLAGRATTIAAGGEQLPFPSACFDVVLCDNVVDHAEKESDTIRETRRAERIGPRRHVGDRLKRWFFKNARWEAIAIKADQLAPPPSAP